MASENIVFKEKKNDNGIWQTALLKMLLFDGQPISVDLNTGGKTTSTLLKQAEQVVMNFQNLGKDDKIKIGEHIYASYKIFLEETGESPLPVKKIQDTWKYIKLNEMLIFKNSKDKKFYLFVLCDCEWNIEHGLQLVLKNGNELVRVSGTDYEFTNEEIYGKQAKGMVVYRQSFSPMKDQKIAVTPKIKPVVKKRPDSIAPISKDTWTPVKTALNRKAFQQLPINTLLYMCRMHGQHKTLFWEVYQKLPNQTWKTTWSTISIKDAFSKLSKSAKRYSIIYEEPLLSMFRHSEFKPSIHSRYMSLSHPQASQFGWYINIPGVS